jgi:hypothetical protein
MKNKLKILSLYVILAGIILILAGVYSVFFTYQKVKQENIITAPDSSIPNKNVRGILTLKAQADIIRKHVLSMTGGKNFSELPREVPKLDTQGNVMLDESGKPVIQENPQRQLWITAHTLITALNLAILAYCVSILSIINGAALLIIGYIFLAKKD